MKKCKFGTKLLIASGIIVSVTLIISGVGIAFAPGAFAATVGSTGALGTASTGTLISILHGAALETASLYAMGNGSVAAGTALLVNTGIGTAVVGTGAGAVSGLAIYEQLENEEKAV